ncbi:MAG: hypothetical protein ACREYF_21370, partial [Gammaproteobacteria bacterium]
MPAAPYSFALTLFATGVIANMCFSRMGFFPFDQSIIFDGGWRILSGQVPWRDFVTPNGVIPAAMQAVFFAALGTNWFAYCLHASIINGLFGVILFFLLVRLHLPTPLACFYGLCSLFFFYPPFGVPYMDQHSFFFTLAAITCAIFGNSASNRRAQRFLWGAVPFLGFAAFLSKQVPFAFAALSLPAILFLPDRAKLRTRLSGASIGLLVTCALCVLLFALLQMKMSAFIEYVFVRSSEVGSARTGSLAQLWQIVITQYTAIPRGMGLTFAPNIIFLYSVSSIAFLFLFGLWLILRRAAAMKWDLCRLFSCLLLAPVMYFTSVVTGLVTN